MSASKASSTIGRQLALAGAAARMPRHRSTARAGLPERASARPRKKGGAGWPGASSAAREKAKRDAGVSAREWSASALPSPTHIAEYPSRPGHVALGTIQVPWMLSGPAILAWYPAQFTYAAGLTGAGRTVAFGRTMTLLSGVACLGAACAARAVVVGVLLAPRTVVGFVEPFVAVETWRADEGVAVMFFAPALFGVAFFGAAFVSFPVVASQVWLFVAPGLYRSEKKAFLPFLLATPILFVAGAALAYYFVFPAAWTFFLSFESPDGGGGLPVQLEAKVSEYLSLVMQLIFAFGLAFQLPVLLTLLAKVGIISSAGLKKYRRYAYVGMFVIAAIITPPDVITQIGLAIPLILLYEISIITAGFVETKPVED